MTIERLREAIKLFYFHPEDVLADPDGFENATQRWIGESGREWSSHEREQLKEEITHATVFCHGMEAIWGRQVKFSPYSYGSHDCILMLRETPEKPRRLVRTLQLKSLTGTGGTLQSIIDSLNKYSSPGELDVAIAIDRPGEYEHSALNIPPTLREHIRELWIIGHVGPDRELWVFAGDMLQPDREIKQYEIRIPGPPPALLKD